MFKKQCKSNINNLNKQTKYRRSHFLWINTIYETTKNILDSNIVKQNNWDTGEVIIPEEERYTEISEYTFFYCDSLSSITIPNSITSIGKCAFADCTRLTNIEIPNSVTEIGDEAFDGCQNLKTINIKLVNLNFNIPECINTELLKKYPNAKVIYEIGNVYSNGIIESHHKENINKKKQQRYNIKI